MIDLKKHSATDMKSFTCLIPESLIETGRLVCEIQDITFYELVANGIVTAINQELESVIKDGEKTRLRLEGLRQVNEKKLKNVIEYLHIVDDFTNKEASKVLSDYGID